MVVTQFELLMKNLIFLCLISVARLSAQSHDSTKTDFSGRCFCESCIKAHKEHKPFVEKKTQVAQEKIKAPKKKEFTLTEVGASIDTGQIYVLKHVRFVAEQSIFMDRSYLELDQLYKFLLMNPTVKISIQGHVNGPGSPNTPYYQKLSEDRTQAVQMYLMEHGIKSARLSKKGFGNSKMLFPSPESEPEAEANRRVEILITAK